MFFVSNLLSSSQAGRRRFDPGLPLQNFLTKYGLVSCSIARRSPPKSLSFERSPRWLCAACRRVSRAGGIASYEKRNGR
jgi:hypothetical protein